ncbi:MAG: IS1182 family transposase [Maioricimonas sp. JB049]
MASSSGYWARPPQPRDQLVLFPTRLDDAIPDEAPVRLLSAVLEQLDFSAFEARYHGERGQPPIHPRILAGVLLYGLMCSIRSSRKLEEAILYRVDFRWLAEGHTPDHVTLCRFRRNFGAELRGLFVQIGLLARAMGLTSLNRLAFDGTRIRANNRRNRSRTPAELQQMKQELSARFEELRARADQEDAEDEERFGDGEPGAVAKELKRVRSQLSEVQRALDEVERIKASGRKLPARIPLTDPESRIRPNKEGGQAANFTPLAGADMESGLVVAVDVIPHCTEEHHLVEGIQQVEEDYGTQVEQVLADGAYSTGPNLQALDDANIEFLSPLPTVENNPAVREDLTQPVPEDKWDQLPQVTVLNRAKQKQQQLAKPAFQYKDDEDSYYCPQGKPMAYSHTTTEKRGHDTRVHRRRYESDEQWCATCPLKGLCIQEGSSVRQVSRDQYEELRDAHRLHMATPESQAIYAQRRAVGERPFGGAKQHMGARQFLLRGLENVKTEWCWLMTAGNLKQLIGRYADKVRLWLASPVHRPPPVMA